MTKTTITPAELFSKLEDTTFTFIRLDDRAGGTIVPYPSKNFTAEVRVKQIRKFLESENTADGIYVCKIKASQQQTPHEFTVLKEVNGKYEMNDAEIIQEHTQVIQEEMKTELITDGDLLELRIQCERQLMIIEQLTRERDEMEETIADMVADLDSSGPNGSLSDAPNSNLKILMDSAKEFLPTLADAFFKSKNDDRALKSRELDIKQAELGLAAQASSSQYADEEVTLESLQKFKDENPQAFYAWLAESPQNQDYYNKLIQLNNER